MRRIAIALALIAGILGAPPAHAAFPGQNGELAFHDDQVDIVSMQPNGTGETTLAATPGVTYLDPTWSPDGTRLTFYGYGTTTCFGSYCPEIYTMNSDGSALTPITSNPHWQIDPAWSNDGTKIAFADSREGNWEIFAMNSDGSAQTRLTVNDKRDVSPDWSPNGAKIAFEGQRPTGTHIFVMDADGSDVVQLTTTGGALNPKWSPDGTKLLFETGGSIDVMDADGTNRHTLIAHGPNEFLAEAAWSPDGQKVVFSAYDTSTSQPRLWIANADGSGRTAITTDNVGRGHLDWQPLPVNTPSTYARVKSATKIHAALVPAHADCTSPNRQHGGAFVHGSCDPPTHLSPTLTVGVGDGSLAFSRSVGSVVLKAITGTAGPPDDADLSIATSITNMMRKADLSDYTGEVGVDLSFQITDREGPVSQTTMIVPLSVTVPCTATPSTIDGATCTVDTTVEALIPSAITEGGRTILELGPVKVRDGGSDEDADTPAGDGTLATQGLFVP